MKAIPGFHPSDHAEHVQKRPRVFSTNSGKEVSKKSPFLVPCPHLKADEGSRKFF